MAREIVWRPQARRDLLSIVRYIASRDPSAALRMKALIEDAVHPLLEHPELHRPGRVEGTREIVVHPNYIVVYRVVDTIEIVAVLHARRRYP